MIIATRDAGSVHIVQMEGQVRISTQNDFKDFLDQISTDFGNKTVLLEMRGVSYMNSAGIGIIVDTFKKFREQNGRLALCSLSPEIQRLLEVTKLNRFIEVFADEASALSRLSGINQ